MMRKVVLPNAETAKVYKEDIYVKFVQNQEF